MQRFRIGLTGLACVFLLVLLAAAFFGFVNKEPAIHTDVTGNVVLAPSSDAPNSAVPETPKEPLAELGVTPGNVPEATANIAAPANRVVVTPPPPGAVPARP